METFLNKKDRRAYEIIKKIENSDTNEMKVKTIASELGLSEHKVIEIIQALNDDLVTDEHQDKFDVYINEVGVLVKKSNFSSSFFLMYFLRRSIYYHILDDLFYSRIISLEEYSDRWFVSKATMGRHWHYLKDNLEKYEIKIIKRNNKFQLEGSEEIIRSFYFKLFKISQLPIKGVSGEVEELCRIYWDVNEEMSQKSIDDFKVMISIIYLRLTQGKYIARDKEYFYLKDEMPKNNFFYGKLTSFYQDFSMKEEQVTREFFFFTFFLRTNLIISKSSLSVSGVYLNSAIVTGPYFTICSEIIDTVKETYNIKMEAEEYFYLLVNLYMMIRKKEVYGELVDFVDHRYQTAIYKKFIDKLPDKLLQHASITTYQLYVVIFPLLTKVQEPLRLMVISSLGDHYREIIEKYLDVFMGNAIVYVRQLIERPDIILSDTFYEAGDIPCIYMPIFPNTVDLQYSMNQVWKIIIEKRKNKD
ncbi:helix-turn-helix domain-containing protein [Vagococcus xieshaowenii]|nr:helix-turn-helix domain-containing protein [Vagococcus xieshaowenii]